MTRTLFILCACFLLAASTAHAKQWDVTILHMNDLHGQITQLPKIATLVKEITAENKKTGRETLLLLGGDMISGTPVSTQFKGEAEFTILDKLGSTADVIGNHEFDFGLDAFINNVAHSGFDILSANIFYKDDGKLLAKATKVVEFPNDHKITIIGLTGKNVSKLTHPAGVADLLFKDQYKVAATELAKISEKEPVIIALTHEGVSADINLAKQFESFDVVIGGHDHVKSEDHCHFVRRAPVCQTPANGKYLGRIDLTFDRGKIVDSTYSLIPVNDKIKDDTAISKIVDEYMAPVSKKMKEKIAKASVKLEHNRNLGRTTPLGAHVCRSMAMATNADFGIVNAGAIRKNLKKGVITRGDIEEMLPYQNNVVKVEMTGADLLAFYKISNAKSGAVEFWPEFDATKIVKNKKYSVATSSFYTDGGDNYVQFKKAKILQKTDEIMSQVFIDYARKEKTLK